MLMIVASLKQFTGDLDHLKRVFRLFGMVKWGGRLREYPEVIDGAIDFVYALWGPGFGQHARTAIGASGHTTISPSKSTASSKSRIEPPVRALRQAQGRGVNTKFSPHPGPVEG